MLFNRRISGLECQFEKVVALSLRLSEISNADRSSVSFPRQDLNKFRVLEEGNG